MAYDVDDVTTTVMMIMTMTMTMTMTMMMMVVVVMVERAHFSMSVINRVCGAGSFNRIFVLEGRTSEKQTLGQLLYFPLIFFTFGIIVGEFNISFKQSHSPEPGIQLIPSGFFTSF